MSTDPKAVSLPEFIAFCREWMAANYPGWKYGAITGSVGEGVPMVVLPITSDQPSPQPPAPFSSHR
jgi:hypothetical protein